MLLHWFGWLSQTHPAPGGGQSHQTAPLTAADALDRVRAISCHTFIQYNFIADVDTDIPEVRLGGWGGAVAVAIKPATRTSTVIIASAVYTDTRV